MDDRLIRYLRIFVLAGAIVLLGGTTLLAWMLLQRHRQASPETPPATLALPADARIGQMLAVGNQLVLLGEAPDARRFLAVLDLATGKRRYLLWIVPEAP